MDLQSILPYNVTRTQFQRDPFQSLSATLPALALMQMTPSRLNDFVAELKSEREGYMRRITRLEDILLSTVPEFIQERLLETEAAQREIERLEQDASMEHTRHMMEQTALRSTAAAPTPATTVPDGAWARVSRLVDTDEGDLVNTVLAVEEQLTTARMGDSADRLRIEVLQADVARLEAQVEEYAAAQATVASLQEQLAAAQRKATARQAEVSRLGRQVTALRHRRADPVLLELLGEATQDVGDAFDVVRDAFITGATDMDRLFESARCLVTNVGSGRPQPMVRPPPSPSMLGSTRSSGRLARTQPTANPHAAHRVTVVLRPTDGEEAIRRLPDAPLSIAISAKLFRGVRDDRIITPDQLIQAGPGGVGGGPVMEALQSRVEQLARGTGAFVMMLGDPWAVDGRHALWGGSGAVRMILAQTLAEVSRLTAAPEVTLTVAAIPPDRDSVNVILGRWATHKTGTPYLVTDATEAARAASQAVTAAGLTHATRPAHTIVQVGVGRAASLTIMLPASPTSGAMTPAARRGVACLTTAVTTAFQTGSVPPASLRQSHLLYALRECFTKDVGIEILAIAETGTQSMVGVEPLLMLLSELQKARESGSSSISVAR